MSFPIQTAIRYCWLATGLVWLAGISFAKPSVRGQSAGSRWFYLLVVVLACFMVPLMGRADWGSPWMFARVAPNTHALRLAGLALTMAGCAFAVWARLTLGRNWSGVPTVKVNHRLVMKGPYALVRHPIYAGFLLALAGTFLCYNQWRFVLCFLIIASGLGVKMRLEERLMMRTFPQEYSGYRRRVKALIPGIL